jgi:hypothetical protein
MADPASRQCQPCTACCDGWLTAKIGDASVRPGHPCPHSTANGCGIYSSRPENPCRTFNCGWIRKDSPLPDWMRPSECGAIIFLWFEWRGQKVINAVPVGTKIPERTLEWLKNYAQDERRPLIFLERIETDGKYAGERCIGFGPADFRESVRMMQLENQQAELLDMYRSLPDYVRNS